MHQFEIHEIIPLEVFGLKASFTNSSAFMLLGGLVWALRSWRAEQAEPDDTPVDREGVLS